MTKKMIYRKALLQAIEAFLEGPPSTRKAQQVIQHCNTELQRHVGAMTIDHLFWGFFVQALTDSAYYEDEEFLRETQKMLRGESSGVIYRMAFSEDSRVYFTADEVEWYAQLVRMSDFLLAIPFSQLHEANAYISRNGEWKDTFSENSPEALRAEKIEGEYLQKKALLEEIAARILPPENVGDEKICQFVLREVTSLFTEIHVGERAVSVGYPIMNGLHTVSRGLLIVTHTPPDVTESLIWARKVLEAITGKREIFLSWRLREAVTFDGDVLLVSLH